MSEQEYNQLPGITASALKAGRTSMAHMRLEMLRERDDADQTPALRWGKLAHAALLEPPVFAGKIAVHPDTYTNKKGDESEWSMKGAACRDWCAEHADKWIVSQKELDKLTAMQTAAQADRMFRTVMSQVEAREVTVEWTDKAYGKAKGRLDGKGAAMILEYKTSGSIAPLVSLMRKCEGYGYAWQMAWYWHGAGRPDNVWMIVQETGPRSPFCVGCFNVAPTILEKAYDEAAEVAKMYHVCESIGAFPGPYDGAQTFERPVWAGEDVDLTDTEGATA